MNEKTVLFPGSVDPFTRGHQALVDQALRLFGRVVIGIGDNRSKQGLLSVGARRRLIETLYRNEPRVSVAVYEGLTGDFARRIGAAALVRGIRNGVDLAFEQTLGATNRRLYPELETVLLLPPPEVADISSSTVRELYGFGAPAGALLPEGVRLEEYVESEQGER